VNSIVLDASALMALLNQEPGAEQLSTDILARSVASTVNLAEVQSKLVARGIPPDNAWTAALSAVNEAVTFSNDHAKITGTLIAETRALGLSLADRACLALALELKAPVYTADRAWHKLKLGIRIHVIR
jgi:ribonuclease VapC